MPDLTERLRSARADLLNDITVPELTGVRSRARTIRRRRRGLQAGATALALVAVVGLISAVVREAGGGRAAPVGTAQPTVTAPGQSVYRGGGLTINGLDGSLTDLPGVLVDVQFADPDLAYAMAADCPEGAAMCGVSLAVSEDGGHSWRPWPTPIEEAPAEQLPRLVTVGTAGVALLASPTGYFTRVDDPEWTALPYPSTVVERVSAARLTLGAEDSPHRCDGPGVLTVLRPDGGHSRLQKPPDMQVCRVAPARAVDGSLWVAGEADGTPAVAVSNDDGANWAVRPLPPGTGAESWALVATVGSEVYATVVSPRSGAPTMLTIEAVYRASLAAPDFQPYAGRIGTVDGEVLPVADGRLVAASPDWYISQGADATLHPAGGILPWVGRIQRSPGGWVAYNLFEAGWVATSLDGITWQKINLR